MTFRSIALSLAASLGTSLAESEWRQLEPLPNPAGVAGAFAGVARGGLVIAGGAYFPDKMPWEGGRKFWSDRVYFLADKTARWAELGKLPRPLAYGVTVSAAGSAWCIGGSDFECHYSDVFGLEAGDTGVRLIKGPSLPVPLACAAGARGEDGTVFVACGSETPGEKTASNRVFAVRNIATDPKWTELPPLPAKARIFPTAAVHKGALYVVGGAALEPGPAGSVRHYLADVWRYSEAEGWRELAPLPKPFAAAASPAPIINGEMWVVGGDDGSLRAFSPPEKHPGFSGEMFAYSFESNTWRSVGKAPAPRVTLPSVAWGKDYVFPSGEVRPGVRSPAVWMLSQRP